MGGTPRRKPRDTQSEHMLRFDFASVTADTTHELFKALKDLELDKVEIYTAAGLAADAANYFVLSIKRGATIMAKWSTETGQEGALPAAAYAAMVLQAGDAKRADADTALQLVLDETGVQTLPAGHIVMHFRYRGR